VGIAGLLPANGSDVGWDELVLELLESQGDDLRGYLDELRVCDKVFADLAGVRGGPNPLVPQELQKRWSVRFCMIIGQAVYVCELGAKPFA